MAINDTRCNLYELNQAYANAIEFLDDVITNRSQKTPRFWVDKFKRGTYALGSGIVRKDFKFYSGPGDQSALTGWRSVQLSRPASNGDPGFDSCKYESEMIYYAMEQREWSGIEKSRRTVDICLKDVKYNWQFEQQLGLIFGFLADDTLSVWENYTQEKYLEYCSNAGKFYVLTDGSATGTPLSDAYNPRVSGEITIPKDINIGTLEWKFLEYFYQYLSLQARGSASGMSNGMPVWPAIFHQYDFDQMIRNTPEIREDYRYANSQVLVSNYGEVREFRGFALMHYDRPPRYRVKSTTADTMTLARVEPYIFEDAAIGGAHKPVANEEYLNAQYAVGFILLNDVFEILVPPAGPASPGGGTKFGAVPSLNGEYRWINIPDRCENLFEEKGFYVARFTAFDKPGEWDDEPIAFLYKRCPQIPLGVCEPCGGDVGSDWQLITAAEEILQDDDEEAGNARTVQITLAECLPCTAPAEVGIDYSGEGGPADVTATVVDDSEGPTYILKFVDLGNYVDGATIVANTTQITCS